MLTAHRNLSATAEYFSDVECNSPGAKGVIYQAIQPAQEANFPLTRFDCAPILEREYNDCALSPQPRAWPDGRACDSRFPSSTMRPPAPLTVGCEQCEDGTCWTSRYGGNDPDVWRV